MTPEFLSRMEDRYDICELVEELGLTIADVYEMFEERCHEKLSEELGFIHVLTDGNSPE